MLISKESNDEIKRINPESAARSRVKLGSVSQFANKPSEENSKGKFNSRVKNLEDMRKSAQDGALASLKRRNEDFI